MPGTPTTRLAIPTIDGSADNVSAYPAANLSQMDILDNAVTFSSGTLAARSGVTHLAGQVYYATDTAQFFDDDGTNWNIRPVGNSGSSVIATSQSRTNTAYGLLASPDQVTGLVLPTSGRIEVFYQATWQESVSGAARAAIFVGANQLKVATDIAAPALTQSAGNLGGNPNVNRPLASCPIGLVTHSQASAYSGDVTTGQVIGQATTTASGGQFDLNGTVYAVANNGGVQIAAPLGGPCHIFAAAGTYTISVQFKASSGSVTVVNRRLYARVIPY